MTGDDSLPGIALLTGPGASRLLERALPSGTRIERLEASAVHGSPGRRTTVRYDADLLTPQGAPRKEVLVASVDRRGLPEGPPTIEAGGETIAVYRAPEDPRLPALALALNRDSVTRMFTALGHEVERVTLHLEAYRPGNRAVVEAVADVRAASGKLVLGAGGTLQRPPDEQRLFLKVVRPGEQQAIADVHAQLGGVMPVPEVLATRPDGLVVMEAVPGRTLRSALRGDRPVPPPSHVVALAVAPGELDLPDQDAERADDRVAWTQGLVRAYVPEARDRIDRIAERLMGAVEQPKVTIHGDFHEGQILISNGNVMGVIDIDDAGPGELVEDLGLITGRLWTLGRERSSREILDYVDGLIAAASRHVPGEELRRRIGVSLFARATAPYRNQLTDWRPRTLGRLDLCEAWLDGA